MEKYIDYIDEDCYAKIISHGNDMYTIDTHMQTCEGYYKKLSENSYSVRIDRWYDKNTKRCKGKSNKLFSHTKRWFAYMVERGLEV